MLHTYRCFAPNGYINVDSCYKGLERASWPVCSSGIRDSSLQLLWVHGRRAMAFIGQLQPHACIWALC